MGCKSRFVEIFGDPASNPYDFRVAGLTELGSCKNGMNFHSSDSGIELPCLGVADFKDYSIINGVEGLSTVSLNERPNDDYFLNDGDIVFVRSNGNKELVGRCLAVYTHGKEAVFSGFCIRLRLNDEDVRVPYLVWALKQPTLRSQMFGRGANVQNLNQKILSKVHVPVPPIELQDGFLSFVAQVDKSEYLCQSVACVRPQLVTPKDNTSVITGAGITLARLMRRKAGRNMDGETNGGQEATQGAQDQAQQGQGQQEAQRQGQPQVGGSKTDYEKQIAERDEKIASLEAQVAEAAKSAETAEQLRGEIAELKAQGESDRIDFKLQLAGVRNVKAARALLADHENDVEKLKEAEPWLFEATGKHAKGGNAGGSGTTGLPNAGAASDEGKTLKHWREIAGLTGSDDDKKKE